VGCKNAERRRRTFRRVAQGEEGRMGDGGKTKAKNVKMFFLKNSLRQKEISSSISPSPPLFCVIFHFVSFCCELKALAVSLKMIGGRSRDGEKAEKIVFICPPDESWDKQEV
jgi:hypothetical protein